VTRVFSFYELAGVAKFTDGAIATGGFIHRSDTGAKVADIAPDAAGGFSVLTQDAGPFDPMITRIGYTPLPFEDEPASEA